MGAAGIELTEWINAETVERAYSRAVYAQRVRNQVFANTGMRAARARDPKLLLALEKGADVLDRMQDQQHGRTRRSSSKFGETVELTEVALWRKAYEFADRGEPLAQLEWIYGAAAVLAGFTA
jgi:hypothetical protein